ncbi:DUF1738 domain-containing protein [Polynucleobacter sp. 86C-FISCH]|uniref:zincin-like metallopeptidase domain-containing protein n=1 Tax=Polynucleobacter sp. 86C-FISCH TaxID=2689101 RepID=UPI001EC7D9A9|nr:zincin-like metallopeptidase domain-containing protein [Polynucleobacter sp. 86C-FISCH]MBU3595101.1 DUF1738 domain-containing protein [Polynucleobacter sp. 86C-FISCH]
MAKEQAITPNETAENTKQDFRARLTSKLIEQLEAGVAPWQKPWDARVDLMPQNPVTGKPYRGINNLALSLEGRSDTRWMTYKQAAAAGYQVNKGERGSQIEYWKHAEQQPKLDATGAPILGPDGKPETINVTLARPRVFTAVVFNAEQMTGVPELVKSDRTYEWAPEERAEQILNASGAQITHEQADRAFYRPRTDSIHMPGKDQFASSQAYYGTALHELGHWTGHSSRLDRDLSGAYGSVSYAKEELRAELASYFLADRLGIPHDPGHHASYVASWVEVLRQDKNEIFKAAAAAEKITEYVMGLEQERGIAHEQGLSNEQPISVKKSPFVEGGIAAAGGLKYAENPYERGSEDHLNWSKGHNDPRAKRAMNPGVFERSRNVEIATELQAAIEDTVLVVPFAQKELAKAAGAKWNPETQFWYAPKNAPLEPLKKWLPNHKEVERAISKAARDANRDPHEEFGAAVRAAGLVLEGQPIMDGKFHRVPIEGKGAGNRDGAYVGHLDGKPAGFIQNHATGLKENWTIGGEELSADQKEQLRAQMQIAKQQREVELAEQHEAVATKCHEKYYAAKPIFEDREHPYLEKKGTVFAYGVHVDAAGNLLIPMRDIDGKLWSIQSISPEGEKRFEAGGQKKGTMYFFNSDSDKSNPSKPIIVAEGFATAATIALHTNQNVVATFDAGNMEPVVAALKERFPTTPIFIAADNDRDKSVNVGVETATRVSEKYGVGLIVPQFPDGMKGSDFNDLASGADFVKATTEISLVRDQIEKGIVSGEEQSRKAAISLGKSLLGEKATALNADAQLQLGTNEFCGKVLGLTSLHVAQAAPGNEVVVHAIKRLDRLPIVGRDLSIKYQHDVGGRVIGMVKPTSKSLSKDLQR